MASTAKSSETRRIGLVGAGNRSTSFLGYFQRHQQDGTVVALADVVPERAQFLKEHFTLDATVYDDYHQMLDGENLDALFVTTEDSAHRGPSMAALERGVHVYCEKPMATTLEDCDAMVERARSSKAVFYLGFNLRHSPVYETVLEVIRSGALGAVTTIEANEYYYGGKTYFRRWNRLRKYGGGLWLTKSSHDLDLLNLMTGGRPTEVYAVGSLSYYRPKPGAAAKCRDCTLRQECPDFYDLFSGDPRRHVYDNLKRIGETHGYDPGDLCLYTSDKDTFDNGMVIVSYDNDIRATYTVNVLAAKTNRRMSVVGTDGTLEADLHDLQVKVTQRHSSRTNTYDLRGVGSGGHGGADDRIVYDFLQCIDTGRKPRSGWEEGRGVVELCVKARESMDSGRPVAFS
jgi:predicted dehydrogenase